MGTNITFNGVVYTIPAVDDVNWGDAVTDFLKAIPSGALTKDGRSWHLTGADLDFGSSYGLVAEYYKSNSSTLAQTGVLRLANGNLISWRNNGNTDENELGTSSDLLVYNTVEIPTISSASTITNKIIDAEANTISNIRDANVATDAAIAYTKLNVGAGEIDYSKLTLTGQLKDSDWSSAPSDKLSASKIDPDFGSTTIITLGGIKLGDDPYVTLSADPTSNYTFTFPAEDGTAGQTLVRDVGGDLVWASVPGLSLPHNNVMVGDSSDLPQPVDTTSSGDILADDVNGFTIKDDVIDNDMIKSSAAIAFSKLESIPLDSTGGTMTGLITLDEEGLLFDVSNPSPAAPSVGQLYYDDQDHTIAFKHSADVTQQIGQETYLYVFNNTGSIITNGSVVYVNSANTARAAVALARANSPTTSDRTIGVATSDIGISSHGYITTFGLVRGLTTNVDSDAQAVSDGDPIYLSGTQAGKWVKTAPVSPYHQIRLGQVINAGAGSSGTMMVSVDTGTHIGALHDVLITSASNRDILEYETSSTSWKNRANPSVDSNEPMGLVGSPTVSYQGTRTIRIAHPFAYWYKGVRKASTGNVDVQVPNTTGLYFIVFTDAVLTATYTTSPDILNQVIYAGFYWNSATSDYMFLEERHGISWSANEHKQAHLTQGARYESGGAIGGYVLASDALLDVQISLDQTKFWDEDIALVNAAKLEGDNFDKWYRDGANGDWRKDGVDTIPAVHSSNVPKINTFSSPNWVLTSVTNMFYFNAYIFGVNSAESTNRYILIPGQNQSNTLAGAQAFTIANLSLGTFPVQEVIPMYQITMRYRTTYTGNDARIEIISVQDLRRTVSPSISAGVNTNHNSLSGRSDSDCHPASAITGTAVTLAGTETLTNKKLTGGTASTSNEWTIPNKSDVTSLNDSTAGNIIYDTTAKKLKVSDGSGTDAGWKVVGGGLITEAVGTGNITAEAGKWYLVDRDGSAADHTVTLPQGAPEAVVQVTVKNNTYPTNKLTLQGYGGTENIWYNDEAQTSLPFGYPEMTVTCAWDSNDSHWLVAVSQVPVNGTWSGSLYLTGDLYGCISPNAKAGSDAAVTLTSSSSRFQYVTLSAARVYKLPSADIKAGDTFTFINRATTDSYRLNIQASADTGTTYVDWIVNGKITVMALQDSPTVAAHWATTDAVSGMVSYTVATDGLGTATSDGIFYKRDNEVIELFGRIISGTVTSSTAHLVLPTGITIGAYPSATDQIFGMWWQNNNGANVRKRGNIKGRLGWNYIGFSTDEYAVAVAPNYDLLGDQLTGNGTVVWITARFPIAEWSMFN